MDYLACSWKDKIVDFFGFFLEKVDFFACFLGENGLFSVFFFGKSGHFLAEMSKIVDHFGHFGTMGGAKPLATGLDCDVTALFAVFLETNIKIS